MKTQSLLVWLHTGLERGAENSKKSRFIERIFGKNRTHRHGMGCKTCLCSEERLKVVLLSGLTYAQCCNGTRPISDIYIMKKWSDSLCEAARTFTLNANSGFWKTEIDVADREITDFTYNHEIYHFIRMPFGLRNAPSIAKRTMDVIFSTLTWKFVLLYQDDGAIFSKFLQEHIGHVRHVLYFYAEEASNASWKILVLL